MSSSSEGTVDWDEVQLYYMEREDGTVSEEKYCLEQREMKGFLGRKKKKKLIVHKAPCDLDDVVGELLGKELNPQKASLKDGTVLSRSSTHPTDAGPKRRQTRSRQGC